MDFMSGLKEVAEAEEWMRKKSGFYVWLKRGGSGRRVDFISGLKKGGMREKSGF